MKNILGICQIKITRFCWKLDSGLADSLEGDTSEPCYVGVELEEVDRPFEAVSSSTFVLDPSPSWLVKGSREGARGSN